MSFFLNSLLIFLILKHSPKGLGAYKYLMIYISTFEFFYSLMDIIVRPVFHSFGSTFLVMVNVKESIFDQETALIMASIYCGCFGSSMAIFGIHFIYRYLVATGNSLLKSFLNSKIIIWFMIPIVYGGTWGWVAYDLVGQKPATGEHIRNNILETFDLQVENAVWIGPYFYQNKGNGTYEIDADSILGMSIVYIIVSSSFFAIIYFGIRCYTIISKLAPSSKKFNSRRLQAQLFWALVTQTMIPVILMHIPVSLVYAFALMDKDIGMLSGFLSMTIAAYPAIDPLPSILIIPHYREALLRYFKRGRNSRKDQNEEVDLTSMNQSAPAMSSRNVPSSPCRMPRIEEEPSTGL